MFGRRNTNLRLMLVYKRLHVSQDLLHHSDSNMYCVPFADEARVPMCKRCLLHNGIVSGSFTYIGTGIQSAVAKHRFWQALTMCQLTCQWLHWRTL